MLNLSPVAKVEKNKLTTNSVFLCLLEIHIPSVTEVIRIVNNNEDINWNSQTWQRFPFEIEEISESSNAETSQFQIKVSNIYNNIGNYVREYEVYVKQNGFTPITTTLYIVNSKDLDNTQAIYSTNLILSNSSLNFAEVTFTVSARDLYRVMTPSIKMYPNSCRFKFKSSQCGYRGGANSCDKTLKRCQELNNSGRFGGFPSIGNQGVSI